MAVLFGYACHPTTLSFTTWCGDYPGFAQLELERQRRERRPCSSIPVEATKTLASEIGRALRARYGKCWPQAVDDAVEPNL